MSTQKGNSQRSRPQKYKNKTSFKNSLHDTSNRTKSINNLQIGGVCERCKEIIEWKIKYKKYKPLSQPRKCVKCDQKNVKNAYHVMCTECGRKYGMCTKCCQSKEVVVPKPTQQEQVQLDIELKNLLETLPERKRRTFLRYMTKKNQNLQEGSNVEEHKDDLRIKLNTLKIGEVDSDFEFSDSFSEGDEDE